MSFELDPEFAARRQIAGTEIIRARVEFVTQRDDKVDPEICAPLDGTVYDLELDTDIPTPPLHRHCRCVLVPVVD